MSGAAKRREQVERARRIVIKVGSSLLSTPEGLDTDRIRALVDEIETLRASSREVVVVTSGAVAAGRARLGLRERPRTIPEKQAAAAVGQIDLMAYYEECFARHGRNVAQILVTRDDLSDRRRYLNAKHALVELLAAGVVPIVNENDTVVVEEIQLGDNDRLSASVAVLVEADLLLVLSDVDGLHTADPGRDPGAQRIPLIEPDDPVAERVAGETTGPVGTGGMATKVQAARKAAAAGIPTLIASGRESRSITRALDPASDAGTLVLPTSDRLARRKHWIAYTLHPAGAVELDDGAVQALRDEKRSLLPSGVRSVEGSFGVGECVRCLAPDGREVARGLVNYNASEIRRIAGRKSRDIESILGYKVSDEVIHRNDLVVT